MKHGRYALAAVVMMLSSMVHADNIYVAYKWVQPGATSFTESWKVMETNYFTDTQEGMVTLVSDLASVHKVDSVVIYYVRPLKKEGRIPDLKSGELNV